MASRILFLLAMFMCIAIHSQNENARWCFGSGAGLNFMNNPPTPQSSGFSATEACSSIADAAGNLKMYTDGVSLYNGNNQQMAGMSGGPLLGGGTKQGVLIVKQPGNNPFYYVFVSGNSGMRYSIVDISLAAGMGSVTVKNVTLTTNTMSYKCAGTRHCNKIDIWIAAQEQNNSVTRAYLLTASGIGAPVLSTTSMIHNVYAHMKFSPDGSKLASTEWGDGIRLYDFNSATGIVSGGIVVSGQGFAAWGIEFSPDGNILYATRSNAYIFQWDLNAGSAAAISASQFSVYVALTPTSQSDAINGALQLAVDGKIYGCRNYGPQMLSAINSPNAIGAACNFSLNGISIAPKNSGYGLPNQVKPSPPLPLISYSLNGCTSVLFSMKSNTLNGVSSAVPSAVIWNFGDPLSGTANSSFLNGPSHIFTSAGTYTVQVVRTFPCGGADTVWQTINIVNFAQNLSVNGNTLLCMGESTTLTATGANSYSWSSASGLLGTNSLLILKPTVSGVYTLAAAFGTACTTIHTLGLHIIPTTTFVVSGNMNICAGQSTTLSASGALTYSWIANVGIIGTSSTQVITPNSLTVYTVIASTTGNTCTSTKVLNVSVIPYPALSATTPSNICSGQSVSFIASGAASYTWVGPDGNMSNNSSITFSPTTSANYTLIGVSAVGNCESQTLINLSVSACLGTGKNTRLSKTNIFPNPSSGLFFIDCGSACKIVIVDLTGREVLERSFSPGQRAINLSTEPDGIYYFRITANPGSEIFRLVKISP